MAVIPAFQLDEIFQPFATGVVINTILPPNTLVFKGSVVPAPSQDELAFNPTFGFPTTG